MNINVGNYKMQCLEKLHLLDGKPFEVVRQEAIDEYNNTGGKPLSETDKENLRKSYIKQKKTKTDYRLYPLYQSIKEIELHCTPTMSELLVQDEDGAWTQTEVYTLLASLKPENAELLKQMEVLWIPSVGKADQLKRTWIKEKVIQTRFSRRGQEFVEKLQALVDDLFSLSTLCINVQLLLNDLTKEVTDV